MISKEILSALSICFTLLGSFAYLSSVYRGHSKPHTISWFIWVVIMLVAFFGQLKEGAGAGSWPTLAGAIQTGFIFCLALRKGDTVVYRFDWLCLFLASITFGTYALCRDVVYSMMLAATVDAIGYLPTYKKCLSSPDSESLRPWMLYCLSPFFAILAIEQYKFVTTIYPVAMLCMNLGLVFLLLGGKASLRRVGNMSE